MTRTTGILLLGGAVAICLVGAALFGAGYAQHSLELAGAVLGFGLLFVIVVAPLIGGGVLALTRSQRDATAVQEAERLRRVLDIVKTRGQVKVSDVVIELHLDRASVQNMVYKLVGMGVFSGYVNWEDGTLYSVEASSLHDLTECKHCGGQVKLVGKGVVKCPYCGTEYFLSS